MAFLVLGLQACTDKTDEVITYTTGTTPSNGATLIPVLVNPSVFFDGSVLEFDARTGAFILKDSQGNEIEGNVIYDDINFILTYAPYEPLAYGETYTLDWSTLLDRAGFPIQGASNINFKTFQNKPLRANYYSGGAISNYQLHTTDNQGRIIQTLDYDNTDTVNPDPIGDTITGCQQITFNSFGTVDSDITYSDNCVTIVSQILNTYDASGKLVNHLETTGTSTIVEHYSLEYNSSNQIIRKIIFSDLAASIIVNYIDLSYRNTTDSAPQLAVNYDAVDNIIGNGDDAITEYELSVFNTSGLVRRTALFDGMGPDTDNLPPSWDMDTNWTLNGDETDDVASYTSYQYSGKRLTLTINTVDDGDNIINATDTNTSYEINTYNGAGDLIRTHTIDDLGLDGEIDIDNYVDDNITSFKTFSYDASGFLIQSLIHIGPGVDSLWFASDIDGNWTNLDDNGIDTYEMLNYDSNGNRINFETWSAGGDLTVDTSNGGMGTAGDDVLLEGTLFDTSQ